MSKAITAEKKLTPKQDQFCLEYLIDLNATQAAIRAGYSEKSAYSTGHDNLKKPEVIEYLSILQEERQTKTKKTGQDVLRELERISFAKVTDVVHFNESGMVFPKSSEDLDEDICAAIESVEVTEIAGKGDDNHGTLKTKVKLHPKLPALNLLAKHHRLIDDKVDINHTGDITLNVVDYSKKGKKDG